ncbi:cytochrome P450 [Rhizobium rhizogenes]|uniref:Cytochrome p450 protein n=1 Tax=Rhizobium rhizogenes (strain K84 / ATCC BAA-868) TaxID=311403 RepID=B9JG73_RHIR8|nr:MULTISPECIES: cytochrome P450 [Rhizobium]ACM24856.1 cytochrome p450 protein [Rhizobium rhizogenes K84]OCI91554.1 cytochrome P450 [Agrobacterium sp. 13-626]EJK80783.1 cytochrome P450 [Rhizobium sp. AP16]MDJ1636867.1 cytochrome P450 [Rhizobium rhizogenes]NTF83143.1 cytochrome P450 [Rhizobium rhizogenes]
MDMIPEAFSPPAPIPRTVPPSRLTIIRTILRNPLELWGEPSYTLPWIMTRFIRERTLIVNDPGLIKHVLVDNAANYRMSDIRQLILRPILRDGLLTAEGPVWKRSRKAVAPVFTPRHAQGFAGQMLSQSEDYVRKYEDVGSEGEVFDIAVDMTELTFAILAETLFSGEIVTEGASFADDVNQLLHRMGRVDPMDLLRAPSWVPRVTRIGGQKVLDKFRGIVRDTMNLRLDKMRKDRASAPDDFLTLLLEKTGPDGLTMEEIEDNILTFIGAGHETTARALAWTLYCVANCPHIREAMETEIDRVLATGVEPVAWLDLMPNVRASFEEAMRLYPPAPSINRASIADDEWTSPSGERVEIPAGVTVLIMPWTLHRHALYWDKPRAFMPERFLPENRGKINRFQYLPFGAGPRVCIGATFALQEAVIALAVMMHRFRFDLTDETNPWPVQKLTTQPQGGLPMRVTRR